MLFESGTLLPSCCLTWDTLFVKIKVLNLKSNFADQTETRKQKTAETGTRFIATASRTEFGRRGPEFYWRLFLYGKNTVIKPVNGGSNLSNLGGNFSRKR